jgi:hypothetical protein
MGMDLIKPWGIQRRAAEISDLKFSDLRSNPKLT